MSTPRSPRRATVTAASPRTTSRSTSTADTVDLPGRSHRDDPPSAPTAAARPSFAAHCADLPAARAVHRLARRGARSPSTVDEARPAAGQAPRRPTPNGQHAYRPTRPKVERKIAHFVRAAWGGRKPARRGRQRVTTDADTRAAAVNWARLATLGVTFTDGRWTVATS